MARARVTLKRRRFDNVWHAYYKAFDADGRLIFQDDGTASAHWASFMQQAEREVGALQTLERCGYRTDKDWHQLVEEAEI